MSKTRERAIKMYWKLAKEKCPFQTEEIVNGYLEGFIDCAELFEEEDKLTLTKYARIIIDKKDECIEDLEKENAELKEKLEIEQNARGDWFGKAVTKDRRLTEAKEIIRDFLSVAIDYIDKEDKNYSFITEAEQFLKDSKQEG